MAVEVTPNKKKPGVLGQILGGIAKGIGGFVAGGPVGAALGAASSIPGPVGGVAGVASGAMDLKGAIDRKLGDITDMTLPAQNISATPDPLGGSKLEPFKRRMDRGRIG